MSYFISKPCKCPFCNPALYQKTGAYVGGSCAGLNCCFFQISTSPPRFIAERPDMKDTAQWYAKNAEVMYEYEFDILEEVDELYLYKISVVTEDNVIRNPELVYGLKEILSIKDGKTFNQYWINVPNTEMIDKTRLRVFCISQLPTDAFLIGPMKNPEWKETE